MSESSTTEKPFIGRLVMGIWIVAFLSVIISCDSMENYSEDQPSGALDTEAPNNPSITINNNRSASPSPFVVVSLSASDNVAVKGYILSSDPDRVHQEKVTWNTIRSGKDVSIDIPYQLLGSNGEKTLYVWFIDEEGNISKRAGDSILLSVTTDDDESPHLTTLEINSGNPITASPLLSITMSATDNQGVIAYYLSERGIAPSIDTAGWISIAATTAYTGIVGHIVSSDDGTKTVYGWFRDRVGNISEVTSDSIELVTDSTDDLSPTNSSIVINNNSATTTGKTVTLDLLSKDNVGITAYRLSENSSNPDANGQGWISVDTTTDLSRTVFFVLSPGEGEKTVYAWFKDAAGNVSDPTSDSIQYEISDVSAPTRLGISINNNDVSTDILTVSIAISARDDTGVKAYYLSEDGATPDASADWTSVDSSTDFSENVPFTLSGGYGEKSVYVFFKDEAENVSFTVSDSILFKVHPYIAAGHNHTCAVLNDGREKCWGLNDYGQLSSDDYSNHMLPIDISGDIDVTIQLSAGRMHTCALIKNGTIKCWGDNRYGELGRGTIDPSPDVIPKEIPPMYINSARQIFAGFYHSCARLENGTVKCWGYNNYGQIGYGATGGSITIPTQVSGINNAVQLEEGYGLSYHTCVTLSDGTIKCWGLNNFGQLGDGGTTTSNLPVQVSDITSDAVHVANGYFHTCAILNDGVNDGVVKCWGRNNYGQLGDATNDNSSTPVNVTGIDGTSESTSAIQLSAGAYHTCALMENGHVKCWGYNGYGLLGNGVGGNTNTPVDVLYINTAIQITSGTYHNCAVLDDGDVLCWGRGYEGQLGIGTGVNLNRPVIVGF